MKAIILAAGMGTRLGKYTQDKPKCMLVFNKKPLLHTQIETLRACGIRDIIVVRGYMPDKIKFDNARHYINKDYENTNMVETLMCAEKELDDDVLVCYSDIIYEKRVIKKILHGKSDSGVTADNDYWPYWKARYDHPENDIESFVIKNNKIVELGMPATKKNAKIRYVGLIKFSKKGISNFRKIYHRNKKRFFGKDEPWLGSKSFKKAFMTSMLMAMIKEGYELNPIIIRHGWLEFDTVQDYERAEKWLKEGSLERFYNSNF